MSLTSPLVTEWISGGETIVVETHRRTGESDREFQSRHDGGVAAAMTVFPED